MAHEQQAAVDRRVVCVHGVVQGVGFRPHVHRLASALQLRGMVRNDPAGVEIDIEGDSAALDRFLQALVEQAPPLARIDQVITRRARPLGFCGFEIVVSATAPRHDALVTPDAATCPDCRAELFDSLDRRYRYPFLNCTHCGPRFTIVRDIPYDRSHTTMVDFTMCPACRREYENPDDRRFHAQPIACPACGPTLQLEGQAESVTGDDALKQAAAALLAGQIVAVKGVGGYHLACDATSQAAVQRLRERKRRDAKPLAVMVADLAAAERLCHISDAERALLVSPAAPIVLLARRDPCPVAAAIAPGNRLLGLMLSYAPLHHLLLAATGRPLVLTSGNCSDEPIAYTNDEARARLRDIADIWLTHDRPIETRCDDSVMRVIWGGASFVRRSRGFAPRPIRVPHPFSRPVLGIGGHLKNTFCLGKGVQAFLSHHIGDLEHPAAYAALREGIAHYERLFAVSPEIVAHDLHPDYLSTTLADEQRLPRVAVQHHHAHVAACAAEHGVTEPVIGVAFDGAGLGTDGAIWGGEFLLVAGARSQRLAHLAYVPLPGGDAAARNPARMALAHLFAAYGAELDSLPLALVEQSNPLLRTMLERGINSPPTSSVGRLFDAVAAILGVRMVAQFEAQAAMELESVADRTAAGSYPVEWREEGQGWTIETAPLIRAIVRDRVAGRPIPEIASRFHTALADLTLETVRRISRHTGIRRVALTGGVFQNALLTERTADALVVHGFTVYVHRQVPCNDGGLAFGQVVVAAQSEELCA